MSDITVYMVVNLKINDAEKYRVYEKGFFPILKIMDHLLHSMIVQSALRVINLNNLIEL